MFTPRCTACDYDLRGLIRSSTGFIRCPECGSVSNVGEHSPSMVRRFSPWIGWAIGALPLVPCWIAIPQQADGWGQLGTTYVTTPLAALLGALVGATVSRQIRAGDAFFRGRLAAHWGWMFLGLALGNGVAGVVVSRMVMETFRKGGC